MGVLKTYISLIKHKIHWLHLAGFTLVISAFTAMSLQQYAAQVFYAETSGEVLAVRTDNQTKPNSTQSVSQPGTAPKPETPKASQEIAPVPRPTPTAKPATASKIPTPAPAPAPAPAAPATVGDIAPESACPGQGSIANVAGVVACMTAYARTHNKVGSISNNGPLVAAAEAKVQDMLTCGYSHTACGREFNYWYAQKGYTGRCSAENIAVGQRTAGEVFIAWMNSAGHRANILNPSYQHVGVAVVSSPSGNLWAMALGGC